MRLQQELNQTVALAQTERLAQQSYFLKQINDFQTQFDQFNHLDPLHVQEAKTHLEQYQTQLTLALKASETQIAQTAALNAANRSLELLEHTHHIEQGLNIGTLQEAELESQQLKQLLWRAILTGGVLMALLCSLWLVFSLWIGRRVAYMTSALAAISTGSDTSDHLYLVKKIANDRHSALREMAQSILAFHDSIESRCSIESTLKERLKEQHCLYDVVRLCDQTDFVEHELIDEICQRLPVAFQYPELLQVHIGSPEFLSNGPQCCVQYCNAEGGKIDLCVFYSQPLASGAWPEFLAEEHALLESIATHLTQALERKHNAMALEKQMNLFEVLFNQSPMAIEVIDTETLDFYACNQQSCVLLGYSHEEKMKMNLADIQVDFVGDALKSKVEQILSAGSASFENRHYHRDGHIIDINLTVQIVELNNKKYMIGIWRDIAAEKQALNEITKLS
ncbi:MAG: PAS domain-containing protein, partial [Deefgea sp.]